MKPFLLIASLAGLAVNTALAGLAYFNSCTVKLESKHWRYASIRVNTEGRVELVRRLSDAPCRYGRSWGFDRNRIWVDDGCSAVFEYGHGGQDDGYRNDRYGNDRYGDDRYGYGRVVLARLESEGGRYKERRFDIRGEVQLIRQISGSPCRFGRSWGYDAYRVWVDDGCRAEFRIPVR